MPQSTIDLGVRFYLVPGFGHASGVFNAGFDALGALDRWVETGKAPEHLVVTDNNRRQHRRTRPLCQWPAYPHYVSGDVNLASSFACAQPS